MEGLEVSAIAIVSELISKFSFIGSLTPQKEFNANLKLSVGLLAGAAAGLSAAAGGMFAFVSSQTQAADALTDFNAETGIAVERAQELGFAAMMAGSSAEAMTSSLANLSKVAGDASRGLGRGKKAFDELGISVTDTAGNVKTADVLFNELRESFARLGTSAGAQKSIIASLGLDPSTFQLLNATSEEVDLLIEKAQALGVVTHEQAQAAAAFQDSLGIAQFGVSALGQQIAISLAPAMQGITDRFVDFLIANKDLIRDGLTYLGEVILSTVGFIERMAPVVLIAAGAFAAWQLATGGLVAILGVLLSPVVLITAGILALLLIVDDLIVAFNGGESVIRDFFLEFLGFDIVPVMQGIVDAFKWMIGAVYALLQPWLATLGGLFSALISAFQGDFTGALENLKVAFTAFGEFVLGILGFDAVPAMQGIVSAFEWMVGAALAILQPFFDAFSSMFDAVILAFSGDWAGALDSLLSAFGSASEGIRGVFMSLFGFIGTAFGQILDGIRSSITSVLPDWAVSIVGGDAPESPSTSGSGQDPLDVPVLTPNDAIMLGAAGNTSNVNSSIEQQNQITVYSNDPKQAGAAVNDALQEQLRTAKTQVNRGGM